MIMRWIYRLFRLDPESRDGVVMATSILSIAINIITASVKILIGAAAGSVAIITEGANNATDASTSMLALVGTKLSERRPTRKHPFGYGRIEYLTSLMISGLILLTGARLLAGSIKRMIHPQPLEISAATLAIIAGSAMVKFWLGNYTIRQGRRADSGALVAVGIECRNDFIVSAITIASAIVYLIFGRSVDAYAGIVTSLIILKSGAGALRETVSRLLGSAGRAELAQQLYAVIRSSDIVLNAADMMLHDYGPDCYSGSVNIEVDHHRSVAEVYRAVHQLQRKILYACGVTMVFGIYAADHESERAAEMRRAISDFVRNQEHITGYHALYVDEIEKCIYCDFVVDYDLRDWNAVRRKIAAYLRAQYPDYRQELTVKTEFV